MAKEASLTGTIYEVTEKFVIVHVNGSMARRPEMNCGRLVFERAFWLNGASSLLGLKINDPEDKLKLLEVQATEEIPPPLT